MIAVTGATGFLGWHLAKALKEKGADFVCLMRGSSRHLERLRSLSCKMREVDHRNEESIYEAIRDCDTVINNLGLINGSEEALREANVDCVERVVKASVRANIRRFIQVSSVAAILRHGPYGVTKYEGERIVRASGLPCIFIQPAYIYGSGDEEKTGLMLRIVKRFPVLPLLGGGTYRIQPIFVEDVVSVIVQSLTSPHLGEAYVLAGADQVSLRAMLELFAKAQGKKRLFIPIPLKPVQAAIRFLSPLLKYTKVPVKQILELDKHGAFDISKTARDFDFHPVPFEEGMRKMFRGKCSCAE